MIRQILDRFRHEHQNTSRIQRRGLLSQPIGLRRHNGRAEEPQNDKAPDGTQRLVRELCRAVLVEVRADEPEGQGADAHGPHDAVHDTLLDAGKRGDVGGDVVLGAGMLRIDFERAVFATAYLGYFFVEYFDDVLGAFGLPTPEGHDLTGDAVHAE